jgi:HEAT repeat protein
MRRLFPSLRAGAWAPTKRSLATWTLTAAALAPAALLVGVLTPTTAQAQQSDADVRQAWREGVALFEQSRFDDALRLFETVLASNPSSELALELRNEAGYHLFVEMLGRDDDLATVARKVLELAEVGQLRERQNPQRIRELIDTMLKDEDYEASYRAMEVLASQVGPFCVPYVVNTLADRGDSDKRVKVIVLLSKLGPDGSNAVIELLYHKDDYVRQNACIILGNIGDIKSVPYLRAVSERDKESPHVKNEAAESLTKITGKDANRLSPAVVYFEALAERYYQEHPSVMLNNFRDWAVWGWKEGKLTPRLVERYAYNDEMAEKVCYDTLNHTTRTSVGDEQLDGVWTILASALFQQVVEVDALLEVFEDPGRAAAVDPAQLGSLRSRKQVLVNQLALAAARGEAHLGKALRKALLDGRALLAVRLIQHMRDLPVDESLLPASGADLAGYLREGRTPTSSLDVEPRMEAPAREERPAAREIAPEPAAQPAPAAQPEEQPETQPETEPEEAPSRRRRGRGRVSQVEKDALDVLVYGPEMQRTLAPGDAAHAASLAAALVYNDKRVRYAAAEALVRLAPTRPFAASAKVVENLSAALGESGSRVVLIVARDTQVRNRLAGIVRDLNHLPVPVPTGKQGLLRARSTPVQDAIIVHTELNQGGMADDLRTEQMIKLIGEDYRSAGTPVFVVTPSRMVAQRRGLFPQARAVLPDNVDPIVLKGELERLWSASATRPDDPKRKAVDIARSAAEAIAEADTRRSVFNLSGTIPALIDAIERQPDEVRVPALRALGNLRARESVDKVAVVFDNSKRLDVRAAAAYCLGEALRGQAVPAKVFEAFVRAADVSEPNPRLYAACSEALGKTRLTREQQLEWFQVGRVD